METLLIKMFATALALSQVTTAPETVAPRFDRAADQAVVAQLLRAGCAHMRKAFDIEDINLDELIATAMEDPQAIAGESKAFRGLDFSDLLSAYRQFCKNEEVATPAVDLGDVTFIDSTGIGVLIRVQRLAEEADVRFTLAAASRQVRFVISVAGLNEKFGL